MADRVCGFCGVSLEGRVLTVRYCSVCCRTAARRARALALSPIKKRVTRYRHMRCPYPAWLELRRIARLHGMTRHRLIEVVILNFLRHHWRVDKMDRTPEMDAAYDYLFGRAEPPEPLQRRPDGWNPHVPAAKPPASDPPLTEAEIAAVERFLLTGSLVGRGSKEVHLP